MILFSRLLMLVLVIVLLVFCMSNLEPITVRMVGWQSPQLPLFLVLLFVFFFGFFLALFWQALRSVTMKREYRPAPVLPVKAEEKPAPKEKKEKKARRWGRNKEEKAVEEPAKDEPKSDEEPDEPVDTDEKAESTPVDVSALEDEVNKR